MKKRLTAREYLAAYDTRKQKKVKTNGILKTPLPNNASSQNASISETTSVIPNEHAKACTGQSKKKRIDSFSNIGENEKGVKFVPKEKVSGLPKSQRSNFKQTEKQSLVADEVDDTRKHLIGTGKECELEEGEIWVDPSHITLIEKTYSRRMEDLLRKEVIQKEQFKSFMETERPKIKNEHTLKSESTNSVHGNLCPQHPSCKGIAFDEHFKSQRRNLIVSQIDTRNKEKRLKEKWLDDANAGKLVTSFDTIPLSGSDFEPEAFKEAICQGEITGCKQININGASKQCVPSRNTTCILIMPSFPHEAPSKTTCKRSVSTNSALPNQAPSREYNGFPVLDGVGNEEDKRSPSQTLSCKEHPIASSTGIVINSRGSLSLLPNEKCATPIILANKPLVDSAILGRTVQSIDTQLSVKCETGVVERCEVPNSCQHIAVPRFQSDSVRPSNENELNIISDRSTEHLPVNVAAFSSNYDVPSVSDSSVAQQEEVSLLQKVDGLGVTNQNRIVSNPMGSEQATNSLQKTVVSNPVCQRQPIDSLPPIVVSMQQYVGNGSSIDCVKKERENALYSKSLVWHSSDNSPTLLGSARNRSTSSTSTPLEHDPIRTALTTVGNEHGINSPYLLVHKLQSTEIVNSEVPQCSNTDAFVDSTHVQLSPFSTFLVEQGQTNPSHTNKNEQGQTNASVQQYVGNVPSIDRAEHVISEMKERENTPYSKYCVRHPSDNSPTLLYSTSNQCTSYKSKSLEHVQTRAALATVENEQGPKYPHLLVHKMQSTEIVNSEVPLCLSIGADVDSTHVQLSPSCSTFLVEQERTNASVREGFFDVLASNILVSQQEPDICRDSERVVHDHTGSTNNQQGPSDLHFTQPILINANLPMHELSPDPLQNEMLRIHKEELFAIQTHEKMKMLLNTTFESEKEKLRKKYETSLQANEEVLLAKKKSLREINDKLLRNQILANSFVPNFVQSGAATNQVSSTSGQSVFPTTWPPSSMTISSIPSCVPRPPITFLRDLNGSLLPMQQAQRAGTPSLFSTPMGIHRQFVASLHNQNATPSSTVTASAQLSSPVTIMQNHPFLPTTNSRPIWPALQPNLSTGGVMQRGTAPKACQFRPV